MCCVGERGDDSLLKREREGEQASAPRQSFAFALRVEIQLALLYALIRVPQVLLLLGGRKRGGKIVNCVAVKLLVRL